MPVTTDRHRPDRHHRVARPGQRSPDPGQRHHHRPERASSASTSPLISALLRLTPSAAVATSGPAGSLTEVRIRGAEANHTLLFVDGIKIDDPASGDTPRFEILNADLASRIEVVRGPQSALWGSEAIGGVIAVNGIDDVPGLCAPAPKAARSACCRASASGALATGQASIAGAVGFQRATGIDSFAGPGDKDGYRNLSGRLRGTWRPAPNVELGAAALGADRPNRVRRLRSVHLRPHRHARQQPQPARGRRLWASVGSDSLAVARPGRRDAAWLVEQELSRRRPAEPHPRHPAQSVAPSWSAALSPARSTHRLIIAAETERETFHARDTRLRRVHQPGPQPPPRVADRRVARRCRRDRPAMSPCAATCSTASRMRPALRASLLGELGGGFSLAGSYAEGIAQPTFFDLYGFFPGISSAIPTSSQKARADSKLSLRYRRGPFEPR